MQIAIAWLSVAAGVALLTWSMRILLRANGNRRVPYWQRADHTPGRALLFRVLGVFFVVLGAGMLSVSLIYWTIAIVVTAFLPGTALIALHNRRLAAAG